MRRPRDVVGERGSATVEHAGLSVLIAALVLVALAALASGTSESGRDVGFALARKLRCAAAGPGPCWRDPLTEAYGRSLAGAVRALAPAPAVLPGAAGEPLLPVDFRGCRTVPCAAPGDRYGITASNRRVTIFTAVEGELVTYWEYRPTAGWSKREAGVDAAEIARLRATPLLDDQVPTLVPLETLPGANHYDFPPGEEPPWRWHIDRR
jgi:hypothetical protein